MDDYNTRSYLSAVEVAKYLGLSVSVIHALVKQDKIKAYKSASGQYRFRIEEIERFENKNKYIEKEEKYIIDTINIINVNNTTQNVFIKNSQNMEEIENNTINLMITSPPYFNTKMYSKIPINNARIHIYGVEESNVVSLTNTTIVNTPIRYIKAHNPKTDKNTLHIS
ncbi:MAG: hypothetical protein DRH51_05035 [Candidatus Coatesbacteria bacterium]|nr:MAG: hypothetical protein DRH51_05035 [Candidatus Coatesbacteria bacterium]